MSELNINTMHRFPSGKALLILVASMSAGLLAAVFFAQLIGQTAGLGTESVMKIATVLQNLLVFLLPAMLVGMLCGGGLLRFLRLDKCPSVLDVVAVAAIYCALTPAMNWLVAWNESVALPDFLRPVEEWMRARENAAQEATGALLDVETLPRMLLSVLLVGVLTGLCEESLFRGALQRVFAGGALGGHVAVWAAAFVFSALHVQFYGFVPRMVLGAFLGYMFWWSGSLWIPVIGHALNNSFVVVFAYLSRNGLCDSGLNEIGASAGAAGVPYVAIFSAVGTLVLMLLYCFWSKKSRVEWK